MGHKGLLILQVTGVLPGLLSQRPHMLIARSIVVIAGVGAHLRLAMLVPAKAWVAGLRLPGRVRT